MGTTEELRQQVAFERWTTAQQVRSTATVAEPGDHLRAVALHLLAGIENWTARVEGSAPAFSLEWRVPAIAELAKRLVQVDEHLGRVADMLTDERLRAPVACQNQRGRVVREPGRDIVEHLMLHGAEHRGRIALLVGAEGGAPVETEYIWWLRNGAGKEALT